MSAGLPGAGLGALLYLVLVLLLPVRTLIDRSGKADWAAMIRQFAIVTAMVSVALLETEFALWLGFIPASRLVRYIPAFLLATVILALEVLRIFAGIRPRKVS